MRLKIALIAAGLLAAALASTAYAERYNGENRGKPLMPATANAKWQAECSTCHMAYPPGLLPAASWKKLMTDLGQHFGTDASLDEASTREITDFLVAHPSNRWSAKTAPLRITKSQWFIEKHSEIKPATFARTSIKSAANCNACHQGAERGVIDEHSVKIPK